MLLFTTCHSNEGIGQYIGRLGLREYDLHRATIGGHWETQSVILVLPPSVASGDGPAGARTRDVKVRQSTRDARASSKGGSPDPGEPRVPSPARRSFKFGRAAGSYSRPAWPVLQHIPPIYKRRTKHPPHADLRLGNSLSVHGTLSLATFCLALPALTPRLQVTTPSGTCLDAAGQLPALDAGPRTSPARRPSLPPSNSPQFPSTRTGAKTAETIP